MALIFKYEPPDLGIVESLYLLYVLIWIAPHLELDAGLEWIARVNDIPCFQRIAPLHLRKLKKQIVAYNISCNFHNFLCGVENFKKNGSWAGVGVVRVVRLRTFGPPHPTRISLLRAPMAFMSSSESLKKTSKFCTMRSGLTDFGITTTLRCLCHATDW